MKRILLWLVGVALGVCVLLGAVMAVSYSFTTVGSCPAAEAGFGGTALAPSTMPIRRLPCRTGALTAR